MSWLDLFASFEYQRIQQGYKHFNNLPRPNKGMGHKQNYNATTLN